MRRNAGTCLLTVTSGTRTDMVVGYRRDPSTLPGAWSPSQLPSPVPIAVTTLRRIPTPAPTSAHHILHFFHLCIHKVARSPPTTADHHHHHHHHRRCLLNRSSRLGGRSRCPIYRAWILQLLALTRGRLNYNIDKEV